MKRHKNSKKRNFGGSVGMSKHRKSGISHNHAVSIARTREYNLMMEEANRIRKLKSKSMVSSIGELFS